MSPEDVIAARTKLGMTPTEFGKILRVEGGSRTVRRWESPVGTYSHRAVGGPTTVAIEALLSGWRPETQ